MQIFSMKLIRKWCEQRGLPVEKDGSLFVVPTGKETGRKYHRPRFRRIMTDEITKVYVRERKSKEVKHGNRRN